MKIEAKELVGYFAPSVDVAESDEENELHLKYLVNAAVNGWGIDVDLDPQTVRQVFRSVFDRIVAPPEHEAFETAANPSAERCAIVEESAEAALRYVNEQKDTLLSFAVVELYFYAIAHAQTLRVEAHGQDEKTARLFKPFISKLSIVEKYRKKVLQQVLDTYGSGSHDSTYRLDDLATRYDQVYPVWKNGFADRKKNENHPLREQCVRGTLLTGFAPLNIAAPEDLVNALLSTVSLRGSGVTASSNAIEHAARLSDTNYPPFGLTPRQLFAIRSDQRDAG